MNLVPTFRPPPTSLGRNLSQHERLGLLLGSDSILTKRSAAAVKEDIRPPLPAPKNKAREETFSLFDGQIVVPEVQPAPTPLEPPSMASRKTNSFAQLANQWSGERPARKPSATDRAALVVSVRSEQAKGVPSVATANTGAFDILDFVGVEHFCRNAGASLEGLRALTQKIQTAQMVTISVLWTCLTSNHATTTVKFCTQSSSCKHWNCTCDRHTRGHYVAHHAMGVVLLVAGESSKVYFLPLMHCTGGTNSDDTSDQASGSQQLPLQCGTTLAQRLQALGDILSMSEVTKVVFNTQIALIPLLHLSATLSGGTVPSVSALADPRLAAYLLDSDITDAQLELDSLLEAFPEARSVGLSDASQWSVPSHDGSQGGKAVDQSALGRVARAINRIKGELLSITALHRHLQEKLAQQNLKQIFRDLEMPVAALLAQMEWVGVVIDASFLDHLRNLLNARLHDTELQIFAAAGTAAFNVASPEQVAHVLYDQLALPAPAQLSKKGKHQSTAEEDLLRIRHLHPVVGLILDYRALAKLLTTYVDGLRPFVCQETAALHHTLHRHEHAAGDATIGSEEISANAFSVLMRQAHAEADVAREAKRLQQRIHANWQQMVVRTGRLSCTKPNLQNVPNKQVIAGLEVNMRSAFHASSGCVLVSADYSQIEVRVLAHLCRDPVLLDLFRRSQDYDIYRQLAAKLFGRTVSAVTEEERTKAKVICLGVLYGMGPQATAAKLSIDVSTASRITQTFFDHFRQIRAWIQQIKSQAKQYGLVRTLMGRVRRLPDITCADPAKAAYAERQAVNTVVQGTASDIIKFAMVNVQRKLGAAWPADRVAPRILMQIHDELIYEVSAAEDCVQTFSALLRTAMEAEVVAALGLTVPLVVNIHTGTDWGNIA